MIVGWVPDNVIRKRSQGPEGVTIWLWGRLSHDGLAKRTYLYVLATFVCVCTNVNVEGKVPVIKVSKPAPERGLLSTIFGSAASTKSNSENDGEILDVTMAKYGHHLAFHVIHPEIGEDGP